MPRKQLVVKHCLDFSHELVGLLRDLFDELGAFLVYSCQLLEEALSALLLGLEDGLDDLGREPLERALSKQQAFSLTQGLRDLLCGGAWVPSKELRYMLITKQGRVGLVGAFESSD